MEHGCDCTSPARDGVSSGHRYPLSETDFASPRTPSSPRVGPQFLSDPTDGAIPSPCTSTAAMSAPLPPAAAVIGGGGCAQPCRRWPGEASESSAGATARLTFRAFPSATASLGADPTASGPDGAIFRCPAPAGTAGPDPGSWGPPHSQPPLCWKLGG